MRCVKTGIKFQVPEFRDDIFHGDMFWNSLGFYLIRGIPNGTSDPDMVKPDLILSPHRDYYMIDSYGESIRKHFIEWNHRDLASDVSTPVIIDDTRFFVG